MCGDYKIQGLAIDWTSSNLLNNVTLKGSTEIGDHYPIFTFPTLTPLPKSINKLSLKKGSSSSGYQKKNKKKSAYKNCDSYVLGQVWT